MQSARAERALQQKSGDERTEEKNHLSTLPTVVWWSTTEPGPPTAFKIFRRRQGLDMGKHRKNKATSLAVSVYTSKAANPALGLQGPDETRSKQTQ